MNDRSAELNMWRQTMFAFGTHFDKLYRINMRTFQKYIKFYTCKKVWKWQISWNGFKKIFKLDQMINSQEFDFTLTEFSWMVSGENSKYPLFRQYVSLFFHENVYSVYVLSVNSCSNNYSWLMLLCCKPFRLQIKLIFVCLYYVIHHNSSSYLSWHNN